MSRIIGIDLGTSNSAASAMEGGKAVIIPSAEGTSLGGKAFPSYVALTKDGQVLIGEPARRQAVSNPEGTFTAFKRKMGTDFKYKAHGKDFTPQQLSAFVLQKIKSDAEAFLGQKIDKAVITVPAYFNDNQRQATKDAGTIAGLEVVRLVNEPTAASLSYGIDKAGADQIILVFDLGGGTLDVTIMEMSKDGTFNVLATSGDTQLGGTDMDNALIDHIAGEFKKESGIDLRNDKMAMQRLKEAAEKAKIELSNILETDINLPFITADASGPKHLTMKISRAILEKLVHPIVARCAASIAGAIEDAKGAPGSHVKSVSDISRIILVGGPTRMPMVQKFVEEQAGKKVERGVDPMECVAMGAAIQGAVLTGDVKDILLLDVTPLTLGIETLGGVRTPLIERNTTVPVKKSETFSTAADSQTSVEVHVLQGERPMASDNVSLGRFMLDGIPPAPRGAPQIEVTFDIDASGILHVTAKDKGTGKEQSIKIEASSKLSKAEVEKYVKEASQYSDADKKKKEEIEAKNELDTVIYGTEKALKDHGDKLSQDERLGIERAVSEAKEAAKASDADRLKKAKDALVKESYKIAEIAYKQSQAKGGGPASAGPAAAPGAEGAASGGVGNNNNNGNNNVVDAEIVDEDKGGGGESK